MNPAADAATARHQALGAAAVLALLLFIVLPGSQYFGNLSEFIMAPAPLAPMLLAPALLFLGLVALALRASRRAEFSRFMSVTAALTLLAWVQSYLLVWEYGLLDGSPIDWGTPWYRGWVDLPLWIATLAAAWVWHARIGSALRTGAIVIVALQAVTLVADAYGRRDVLALKATQHAATRDLEAMAHFSSQRNVLHIILDSFQADIFKDIIDSPAGEYFVPALSGFTYFEEHVGTFPATYFALPAIVSGQVYKNHLPQAAFMESAFGGKSILNAAHDAGFEVDLASDPFMLSLLMKGRFENALVTSRSPAIEEAAGLLDLALFRLAPHWLKQAVYSDQRWLLRRLAARDPLSRFPYYTHNAFLADITRRLTADREKPVYKFFHLMTTHAPFVVNPDCSFAGKIVPRVRETVTAQSQCSLSFVVALLERMKQAGIYDDSLIVIMGDHGGHIPPRRYRHASFRQGDMEYDLVPSIVGLATPLLAIKPPGASRPLKVSDSQTSMIDVAATIDALLGLEAGLPGRSVMEPREPGVRRNFHSYTWSKKDPSSEYISDIVEYPITGTVYDAQSWHLGERFSPPAR